MSAPEKNKSKSPSKAPGGVSGVNDYRIPAGSSWAGAWKIAAGVGVLGLAGAAAGWATDPGRFAFSYLFAFFLVLTVALGSMFFVLVDRLTAASWSVGSRRTAEFFAAGAPVFFLLFLPLFACMPTLYPWMHHGPDAVAIEGNAHAQEHAAEAAKETAAAQHQEPAPEGRGPGGIPQEPTGTVGHPTGAMAGHHAGTAEHVGHERLDPEEAAEEELLTKKRGWLNKIGWIVRSLIYFAAWAWIGTTFFRLSAGQDATKDPKLTLRAQKLAPVATMLFGFTLTGAAFDWLMSLLPTWYSTIFGVTIFAGSVVCMYATLIIVTMSLREAGHLKNAINVEHFHDMGKLMFGFLVFWAYVSFAQFMLIWYAALPDETSFYHHRWDVGPWATVSLGIVICHFVIPFFLVLSRNVKRRLPALRFGAAWLLVMHLVEMYWFVMPNYGGGEGGVSWIDAACLLGIGGVYLAVVFHRMTKYPLIPVGDPRLSRSLTFENA